MAILLKNVCSPPKPFQFLLIFNLDALNQFQLLSHHFGIVRHYYDGEEKDYDGEEKATVTDAPLSSSSRAHM
jgi:hypothetical protein